MSIILIVVYLVIGGLIAGFTHEWSEEDWDVSLTLGILWGIVFILGVLTSPFWLTTIAVPHAVDYFEERKYSKDDSTD